MPKTSPLVTDSPGNSLWRKGWCLSRQSQRSLYTMKSTRMPAVTAAALSQASASIADILSVYPALQLAGAVVVGSSWRHGGLSSSGRLVWRAMMNFWEAHGCNAKTPRHQPLSHRPLTLATTTLTDHLTASCIHQSVVSIPIGKACQTRTRRVPFVRDAMAIMLFYLSPEACARQLAYKTTASDCVTI